MKTDTKRPKSVSEIVAEFECGYFTFQFSYLDKKGKEVFEVRRINDPVDSSLAVKIASDFASEHGANRLQWVVKNSFMRDFLRTQISSLIEAKIEEMEGEKRRMDVGDFGADSVSFPGGQIWNQERRATHNAAITRAQSILKEALV